MTEENVNVENMNENKDFDLGDYLNQNSGDRYFVGKTMSLNKQWRVKVLSYEGVKEKEFPDGKRFIPYLKVQSVEIAIDSKFLGDKYCIEAGKQYLLAVNRSNAQFLKDNGLRSFKDLIGKNLIGITTKTPKGNGLVFTEIK